MLDHRIIKGRIILPQFWREKKKKYMKSKSQKDRKCENI